MENKKRELFLDYSKSFILLFMIMTHILEEWPSFSVQFHPFFYFLYGRGLLFGATAFMLSMGWTLNYSRNSTPKLIFKRGLHLLYLGYLLNLLRSVSYFVSGDIAEITELLLCPDIMQFAGFAMMMFSLAIKYGIKPWIYPVGGLALAAIGAYFAPCLPLAAPVENPTLGVVAAKELLGLFYYTGEPYSCFPLLNWFVFPAVGYWVSSMYLKAKNQDRGTAFMQRACAVSYLVFAALMVLDHFWEEAVPGLVNYSTFLQLGHNRSVDLIYNVTPLHAILASSFIVGTFAAVKLLLDAVKKHWPEDTVLDRWALAFSRNINNVYFAQWIIIENIAYFLWEGNRQLSLAAFWISYFAVLAATIALTILYSGFISSRKRRS